MAKKKPHQRKGGIENYYEENKPEFIERTNFGWIEIRNIKSGYQLDIIRERGIDQKLFFDSREDLDNYVKNKL